MKTKYFGTDGIRGRSFDFLNAKMAYKIGQSFKEVYDSKKLVIGLDTRDSSMMLAHMVASGAMSVGIDVIFAGVVPTPMISNYALKHQITGVMVTASHNPYYDNGIKIFNKGQKSSKHEELIIETYIDGKEAGLLEFGNFELSEDVKLEYLKVIDALELKKSDLKIVYDSAHGANYLISKEIFDKYYPNSVQINFEPNGKNINKNVGSTYLDSIKDYIRKNNMDLGFSYDGDGDRVLMVGSNGLTYDGDMINYIIATHLKTLGKLRGNTVVLTKMTNPGILKALKDKGINYILTDVGDKYVSEQLELNNYSLGGESSGHIIIRDLLHTGDGLLASLYIIKTLIEEDLNLDDIVKDVKLYPFEMINIKNINKEVLNKENVIKYLTEVSKEFEEDDIFLIRASGTEPLIRVTISCSSLDKLNSKIKEVVEFIKKEGELT